MYLPLLLSVCFCGIAGLRLFLCWIGFCDLVWLRCCFNYVGLFKLILGLGCLL